jgi:acylphosphatase
MNIRANVTVRGLVQGVNFRYFTRQTAQGLNVNGWVMNLPDGSVAGCFEGEEAAVQALIDWCRRGPSAARVDEVLEERQKFQGEFAEFVVRR